MKKNISNNISVDLSNKIAVVTGGAGSIGREICKGLLYCGANVIAVDRRANEDKLLAKNKRFHFLLVDIANEQDVIKLSRRISRRYGAVDILILSHGIQLRKPFYDITLDEWRDVIDINLTGAFLACKYLTLSMIKKGYGKIIGVTSLTSKSGIRNISAYAASKAGLSGLLRTVAIELAGHHINVNMIAPGRIKTKMTEDIAVNKNILASNLRCIPMARFGAPSDLVGAALFLASGSSDYMTGQTIYIDGGWVAGIGNPEG